MKEMDVDHKINKSDKKIIDEFYPPLPLEEEIDEEMIKIIRSEGIDAPFLLQGRMSAHTCNILNQTKLKHRTCKYRTHHFSSQVV
jgi:hypothetical protein